MSLHLSVLPNNAAQNKFRQVLADLGKVFENQSIPVNYVDRDSYHIKLLSWSSNPNLLHKNFIKYRINKFQLKPFVISTNGVRLGISRKYRELLLLPIYDGADEMRDLVYDLSQCLRVKRSTTFIPHISLGRVAKDLSDEEFHNLTNSIHLLNTEKFSIPVRFQFDGLALIQTSSEGSSKVLRKFSI